MNTQPTSEPTLKEKTAKGLFWGGFSSGVQQVLGLAFGIILARILTQDDYGMIGVLIIFSQISLTFINSGFSVALINKQDANHKDYNAVFWFTIIMGTLLYLILFLLAPLIAQFYKLPELISLSRFLFISCFIIGISTVSNVILLRNFMVKQIAVIESASLLLSSITGVVLALRGYSYWALAIQSVLGASLPALFKIIIAPWRPTFHFDFSPLKPLFAFSFKLLITYLFSTITTNIFSVIIGKFYTTKDVGNYSQGQKWSVMGSTFIATMINYVTQPLLAQLNEDHERQINALRKLIRFGALISFPLMLGLAFVAKEFIVITIGAKWLSAVPFLQLFCLWGSVLFISNLYTNLIYTHGKSNIYMKVTIIIGFLQLGIILLMYSLGNIPMVTGYIAISILTLFIWHYYVNKIIGLKLLYVIKDIMPYCSIAVFSFVVAWFITRQIHNIYIMFTLKIVISGILYVIVLSMTNSVLFKECVGFLVERFKNK